MYYKTTAEFESKISEKGFKYNDPEANLCWPDLQDPIISTNSISLKELMENK